MKRLIVLSVVYLLLSTGCSGNDDDSEDCNDSDIIDSVFDVLSGDLFGEQDGDEEDENADAENELDCAEQAAAERTSVKEINDLIGSWSLYFANSTLLNCLKNSATNQYYYWSTPDDVRYFSCDRKGIYNAGGIEQLTGLTSLRLHFNRLTDIDVSANRRLDTLQLENNQLSEIDISYNPHSALRGKQFEDLIPMFISML